MTAAPVPAVVTTAPAVPAVAATGLSCAYTRGRPVLHGVDLTVAPGAICMILGPSGSGKSTLLKAMKGLVPVTAGSLDVLGVPVAGPGASPRTARALQQSIAWIPQNLGLVRSATVLANVLTGALGRVGTLPSLVGLFPEAIRQEARATLEALGIAHKADDTVFTLSGGERQRVAIGRALMQRPRLVLADEFVSHLDVVTTREIMAIVSRIARTGVSFLITSHAPDLAADHGDLVVVVRDGRKVYEGAANAFTRASVVSLLRSPAC
jgi:phosphonate transport system ATP-binding protein